ncbi:hypothetical protein [Acinetobacter sp. 1125_18A]|jgi:hypothetical protein|uniref:hypothetical protein n=1 Tax=Acinetobacter sp. 1125_18A TaxID=2605959 RepID=UPI004057FD23
MLIISASEVNRISDSLHKSYVHQIQFNLIGSILESVSRGDQFANVYLPSDISNYEVENLSKKFKEAGYKVKVIQVGVEVIFSISW